MALLYAGSIVCWAAAARYFGARVAIAVAVRSSRLPGLRADVPRALERARLRGGVRGLGAARRRGPPSHRRPDASRSSASASPSSRSSGPGTPCCSPSRSFRSSSAGHWRVRLERTGAFVLAAVLPLLALVGAQRRSLRLVGARARRQRDHPLLPRVHHRQHRLARERRAVAPARSWRCSSTSSRGSRTARTASRSTSSSSKGASASTRTSTSSPTRSSAGTPTTACSAARASRACARTPARMRAACADGVGRACEGAVPRRVGQASREAAPSPSKPADRRRSAARRCPRRREGEPIPAGQVVWISRPDQSIRQVWTSPTEWHFEFDHPADRPRFERITRETSTTSSTLSPTARATRSSRSGSTSSRAGSRGRGCGSCSAWSPSPCVDRAAGRCWSRCRSQRSPSCS